MPNETSIMNKKSCNMCEGNLCASRGAHFFMCAAGGHKIKKSVWQTGAMSIFFKETRKVESNNKLRHASGFRKVRALLIGTYAGLIFLAV